MKKSNFSAKIFYFLLIFERKMYCLSITAYTDSAALFFCIHSFDGLVANRMPSYDYQRHTLYNNVERKGRAPSTI